MAISTKPDMREVLYLTTPCIKMFILGIPKDTVRSPIANVATDKWPIIHGL